MPLNYLKATLRHAQSAKRLAYLSGGIFSFAFRLSQTSSDIFSLQGRFQAIGLASPLHAYLRFINNYTKGLAPACGRQALRIATLPRPAESPMIYHGDECCKSGRPQCPAF